MTEQTPTRALEPCPFCGAGETQIHVNKGTWLGHGYGEPVSVEVRHWCANVPGQPSRMISRAGRDEASAIAAWNTRAKRGSPVVAGEPQPSTEGPPEVWLQLHGDCAEPELSEPVDYTAGDVTWCWHSIHDSDVRYVRADLATTPQPTQAQAGAPLSKESLGVRSKAVLIANAIESANNHDDLAIAADDAPAMIRTLLALVDLRERQPTQAQAGAVPLTDAQIRAMLNKHPPEDVCGWSYRMGIDDAELHHGIKGGQHGTE